MNRKTFFLISIIFLTTLFFIIQKKGVESYSVPKNEDSMIKENQYSKNTNENIKEIKSTNTFRESDQDEETLQAALTELNKLQEKMTPLINREETIWMRYWPKPQTSEQKVFLQILAISATDPNAYTDLLVELTDLIYDLGAYDSLHQYMFDILHHADQDEHLLTRVHIYEYNAHFAVDPLISDMLIADLNNIHESQLDIDHTIADKAFNSLVNSYDIDPISKLTHAIELIEYADEDTQAEMMVIIENDLRPVLEDLANESDL